MNLIKNTSAFTLIELMLVITMIGILMSITMIPYGYYMDRARVERSIDQVSQEWILAHNNVRNGVLTDNKEHNAHMYVELALGKDTIDMYTSTGGTSVKKLYKTVRLDDNIEILGFSGITLTRADTGVTYEISPPFATGAYSTGGSLLDLTGITMTIGYTGATDGSPRKRDILLRPYYN